MIDPVNVLDDNRIEIIRASVLGYVTGEFQDKMSHWRKCTKAIAKKMSELKKSACLFSK